MSLKKERHCINCGRQVYQPATFCGYCGQKGTITTVLDLPPFLYVAVLKAPFKGANKMAKRYASPLLVALIVLSTLLSGWTTAHAASGLSEAQITSAVGQSTWWIIKGESRAVQAKIWDGYMVDGTKLKSIQYNKQTFLPGSTVHTVAGDDAATYWLQGTVSDIVMSNPGSHASRSSAVPAVAPAQPVTPVPTPVTPVAQQPAQSTNSTRSNYVPFADYRAPGAVWDIWWPVPQDQARVCVIAPSTYADPSGKWASTWKVWLDADQKPAFRSVAGTCYAYDAQHISDAHFDYDHTALQPMSLEQLDKVAGRIWNAGYTVDEIDHKFGILRTAQGTDLGLIKDNGAVVGMVVMNRPAQLDELRKLGFTIQGDPNSQGVTAWSPESWRPMRNNYDAMNPRPPVGAGCPSSQSEIGKVLGMENIMQTLTDEKTGWIVGLKVGNLNSERIALYSGCGWTLQGDNPSVKSMWAPEWLRPLPTN
jgi:hypothetical protein